MTRETVFSPCRKYRYTLWRAWALDLFDDRSKSGFVQFIGLNPSTADEMQDDPTIRRCLDFTRRWGYSTLCMTNLFAWRETLPREMKKVQHPTHPEPGAGPGENDVWIETVAAQAALVIAAWGRDGKYLQRGQQVMALLKVRDIKVHHLGLNDDGTPKHPLYLKATTEPVLFEEAAVSQ